MKIDVDRSINAAENTLSKIAAVPVVGTLAGAIKVVMGGAQTIVAGVCGLVSLIPGKGPANSSLREKSLTHVKHGLGNMAGGVLEAIPLVGTGLYVVRKAKEIEPDIGSGSKVAYLKTQHEFKWMPYASLVKVDLRIKGADMFSQLQEDVQNNCDRDIHEWCQLHPHADPSLDQIKKIADKYLDKATRSL